jgi:hypothetical protein
MEINCSIRKSHNLLYLVYALFSQIVMLFYRNLFYIDHIGGVMVCMLTLSAVDRGFAPRSGQIKDYEIGICCYAAKHSALRRKNKDWLSRNQNNLSEWSDMSSIGLLFQ